MRLRELREKHGFLQKDIADRLKVNRTTYTKWESGASEPSIPDLCILADIFSCSVDYLIEHTDVSVLPYDNESVSSDDLELIARFRMLNAKGRSLVSGYLNMLIADPDYRNEERSALGT